MRDHGPDAPSSGSPPFLRSGPRLGSGEFTPALRAGRARVRDRSRNSSSLPGPWPSDHWRGASTPGRSTRAQSGEIPDGRLGDGAGAGPDEEEQRLASPALGGLGAEEAGPLARREIGL